MTEHGTSRFALFCMILTGLFGIGFAYQLYRAKHPSTAAYAIPRRVAIFDDKEWIVVENAVDEKAELVERTYFLVDGKRRVRVTSRCRFSETFEDKIGDCRHQILDDTSRAFEIAGGVRVYLAHLPLAHPDTVIYAAYSNGGDNLVELFARDGTYLGKQYTDVVPSFALTENPPVNFNFPGQEFGYLVMAAPKSPGTDENLFTTPYIRVDFTGAPNSLRKLPIQLDTASISPVYKDCSFSGLRALDADMKLVEATGEECDAAQRTIQFQCKPGSLSWVCGPTKVASNR